jgi:hypothetical protein
MKGDDMNSKGGESPLARAPGTNPLIKHLEAMYEEIKQRKSFTNEGVPLDSTDGMQNQQALDRATGDYYKQLAAGNTNARVQPKAAPGTDLGNDFKVQATQLNGQSVLAVLDQQNKTFWFPNMDSDGKPLIGNYGYSYVVLDDQGARIGQPGQLTLKALQQAGLAVQAPPSGLTPKQ